MLNRGSLTPIYPASLSDCLIQTDPLPNFDDIGPVALRTRRVREPRLAVIAQVIDTDFATVLERRLNGLSR